MSDMDNIKRLEDYTPPEFLIPETRLEFEILDESVRVTGELTIERNPAVTKSNDLVLDGENLKLLEVSVDDRLLSGDEYIVTDTCLTVFNVPEKFTLRTVVEIDPYHNTELEGLYKSGAILCTQNEPQGFRRITYFIDRPDVMSVFSVGITAERKRYPYLLSNGNQTGCSEPDSGLHRADWLDPFPKPCYLFALVAGDFALTEDSFTTASGREVQLRIFVDHGNEDRVAHTMASLKRAMRWDEVRFGLEYDLDLFMIVAVDAFNMGAMENKGLNIFNSACALANNETATDADFMRVDNIVAHEYFHNWTGDRITLRDWFQLTLKEGLTVYRDGEYMADTYSRPIKRIEEARGIRSVQFAEDAGPNAHPIQPKTYREINNFYTSTVYQKGSEVIRMLEVILGRDGFRRGMDRYVEVNDGKAVTTEDFLMAMEEGNGVKLEQFRRWYHQAGTPRVAVSDEYDAGRCEYRLKVSQSCPATADGSPKEPFYIPMVLGLVGKDGRPVDLKVSGGDAKQLEDGSCLLIIDRPEQEFVFEKVAEKPVPSLFRGFSAPVRVDYDYSQSDLMLLMLNDSDEFNRYDSGQRLALGVLLEMTAALQKGNEPAVPDTVLEAFFGLLTNSELDPAFRAHAMVLPTVSVINQELEVYDFTNTFRARELFKQSFANRYQEEIRRLYDDLSCGPYRFVAEDVAKRSLRNLSLDLLSYTDAGTTQAAAQYEECDNMTDRMAALKVLCASESPQLDKALADFLERYRDDFNVISKWFTVQASAARNPKLYEHVCELAKHKLFDKTNPNRLRSLYGVFCFCPPDFHHASGRGYRLIADAIIDVDSFNTQMSAGLAKAFRHYAYLAPDLRDKMRIELERILAGEKVSAGLREIVENTLAC